MDLLRQEIAAPATTIVVKMGTRVLTRPDGGLVHFRLFWGGNYGLRELHARGI